MNLSIELYVSDLNRSVQFYRDIVGLRVQRTERNFAVLARDKAILFLAQIEDIPKNLQSSSNPDPVAGWEFIVEVEDINTTFRQVESSGYPIYADLTHQPWGKIDFRVVDPDGVYIRFSTPEYNNQDDE